jgi:adenine nucleotide transporter 17
MSSIVHALAGSNSNPGAGGGIISMALTYPLVTISTRSQVDKKTTAESQIETAKKIIKAEGIRGLYS